MKTKKVKGFTLTELLVFTAIAGIVLVILLSVLVSFLKTRSTAKKLSTLQDVAIFSFNELTQEIHWSDLVEIPTVNSAANQLKLVQDLGEPTERVIVFNVSGDGQLLKNDQPISLPKVKVNSLTITNFASSGEIPLLEIKLKLQYPDPQKNILSEHQTTISLRKTKFETFEK